MMAQPQLVSFHTFVTSSDWLKVKPSRTKDQSVDKKGREHAKKEHTNSNTSETSCLLLSIERKPREWWRMVQKRRKKTLRTNLGPLWRVKKGFTAESDQVVMTKCVEGEAREKKSQQDPQAWNICRNLSQNQSTFSSSIQVFSQPSGRPSCSRRWKVEG